MQETWFDSWVRKICWRRDRLPTLVFLGFLPGASTGDSTHDKVMRKRPDKQGRSGLEGLPGPARASTPKPKSVCLLFNILCFSPTLLTLTGGYPQPPFSEEDQLRALVNKSPGHERSISIQTSLGILACLAGLSILLQLTHMIVHNFPTMKGMGNLSILKVLMGTEPFEG